MVLSAKDGRITLRRGGRTERLPDGDPLEALRDRLYQAHAFTTLHERGLAAGAPRAEALPLDVRSKESIEAFCAAAGTPASTISARIASGVNTVAAALLDRGTMVRAIKITRRGTWFSL